MSRAQQLMNDVHTFIPLISSDPVDAGEAGEGNLEILVSALDTNIPTRLGLATLKSYSVGFGFIEVLFGWVWLRKNYYQVGFGYITVLSGGVWLHYSPVRWGLTTLQSCQVGFDYITVLSGWV